MRTLLLDQNSWDLTLDASGNVATAGDPYSQAQDAASAMRLVQGTLWYDTAQGVPYFAVVLGRHTPLDLARSELIDAGLTVPGVVKAKVLVTSIVDRRLRGQVQITNSLGQTAVAGFG